MGTLRTLQILGALAKIVGGFAGAGIGIYEIKEIRAMDALMLPDKGDEFDPDLSVTVDCSGNDVTE